MPDATDITELDARTVERIAAGEVVERPASVVKELVENAVDADADRIDVAVEAGGTEGVVVSDDGVGMTEDGVRQAVREHTTSKIGDIDDLEGGVGTLGFRGEALHAIGAVSRLTVTTCPRDADGGVHEGGPAGTELVVEGGEVTSVSPAGRPPGTTVAVADLFYNVPARRKYLKTAATEFGHVTRIVRSYALANPDVAVSLEHDGSEVFATTGTGDRREAIMAIYGREVASSMLPVDPGELPEGPLEGVTGLVSHPETNRASREYLSTFVNGRYVTASAVREAVVDAYETHLGPDRYPFAVLDLSLDPGTVDVNVHPRKLEVRFADEAAVREQVRAAVHAALMREGIVRTRAPRGRSAPDETAVSPESGSQSDGTTAEDPSSAAASASNSPTAADHSGTGDASSDPERSPDGEPAGDPTAGESPAGEGPSGNAPSGDTEGGVAPGGGGARGSVPGSSPSPGRAREGSDPHDHRTRAPAVGGATAQTALGDADGPAAAPIDFDALPSLRLLGQFRDTYLVAAAPAGLVLIDQHAADERVNYESLREALDGEVTTQALAQPVTLSLTAGEAAVAEAHREALAQLGFRLGPVEDGVVEVRTVPDLVGSAADPDLLRDVLGDLVRDGAEAAATVEAAADAMLADMACYPSITGNTSLAEGAAVDLLERLDDCENPWACPHGRPTVIVLEDDELEARFERDYPGH